MRAVIFDMDGIMFDTERLGLRAWKQAGLEMGIEITDELAASFRGSNKEFKRQLFNKMYGPEFDFERFYFKRCYYLDLYLEEEGVPVKPGLVELLKAIKEKGYLCAVATSTNKKKATSYLKETGVYDYFDSYVFGDDVEMAKPNPEIFLKAANRLETPIDECYILEDSFNGIRAAFAAGATVCMIPDLSKPTPEIAVLCDYIFGSLFDVIEIL